MRPKNRQDINLTACKVVCDLVSTYSTCLCMYLAVTAYFYIVSKAYFEILIPLPVLYYSKISCIFLFVDTRGYNKWYSMFLVCSRRWIYSLST